MMTLSSERQNVLKRAAQNSLINYCEVIDKKYEASWHHEAIAEILENALFKVLKGEKARIILELPPRHGKSELATIKFPSWVLGQNPDLPVMIASYSAELAEDFGQKTRDLMNDEIYQLFFKTRLRPDTKAKGKWMTEEGGGYTATGVGGAITGRGFKLGIVDDPFKNREEAESELMRNKIWDWWTSTFYTRAEGITAIVLIMTRWHEDDLVGRLIEQQKKLEAAGEVNYDRWEIIRFPAIAEENEPNRKKGDALWPDKFPIQILESIKNSIGIMDFESLYQQNPLSCETMEFKQEYFRYFEEKDLPQQFDIDITVDPAISKKKTACNTSIMGVGKARTIPDWFILDYKVSKMDPGELIKNTFELHDTLKTLYPNANIRVWVEGVAYQEALKYFFEEEMKRRKEYFLINTFIDKTDKEQRIRGLIPMYKIGIIKHRPWMKDLENEAMKFPKGKTVDIVDSLSFNLHIKPTTTPEKPVPHTPMAGSLMERIRAIGKNNQNKALESIY